MLSIILPSYNPPLDWLSNSINSIREFRKMYNGPLELIIVNDGGEGFAESEIYEHLSKEVDELKLISYSPNRGKGYALRQGVREASGEKMLYTDIDFPYRVDSMYKVLKGLDQHNIAVGIKDEVYYNALPLIRRRISRLLIYMNKLIFRLGISDTQCGLKSFDRRGAELFLETKTDRYLFDLEFISMASRDEQLKMLAVPVELRPGVTFRKMNYKILFQELGNFIRLLFKL